ncbi:MAG: group-specific protein [Clostridia bacterium]|nr:group-specific protein [Clostridia bacterium]
MRFYIATGINNAWRASALAEVLKGRGHEHTYDWTVHGDIRREGDLRMGEVAFNELRAVRDAELVVVLLPGGSGTHTELGVAIATRGNKRIILWSEEGEEFNFDERTCTFYFHPSIERVVCPFDELLRRLDKEQIGSDIR